MSDVANLSDTIVPKSDQLNADQLLGGSMTITVTEVRRGQSDDQPVLIHYAGDEGRPYKPCKTMRKVLIFAWSDDGRAWIGRAMTLYNDPEVKFGGVKVGGTRISHMSHIHSDIALSLTSTKGKKQGYTVRRLEVQTARQKEQMTLDKLLRAVAKATAAEHLDWCRGQIQSLPDGDRAAAEEAVSLKMASINSSDSADAGGRFDGAIKEGA